MAKNKQDVRVTKTQRALVQALLALLENQSFGKITVNDICREALVSRSTFYAHFEDKYALLRFSMQEMKQRIFADAPDIEFRALLLTTLEKTRQNEKTLRNLIVAELDVELMEMFRQHFISLFQEMLHCHATSGEISPEKAEVMASFYAAGVSQTIALWIGKKLPLSTEDMADTLCQLLPAIP